MIRALVFCALLLFPGVATAASVVRAELESEFLGEARPLNIVLPDSYDPDEEYPVVIALDGSGRHIPQVADLMHEANPRLIVVGVENTDRSRDMFPERMPARGSRGGGGANFLAFLVDELVPFVDEQYSTDGFRVISGQSNSGFFVLYALTRRPDAFDGYLASSPMIGWDKDMVHDGVEALFESRPDIDVTLYMNRGENDYAQVTDFVPDFESQLVDAAPSGFGWRCDLVRGGGHVPMDAYRAGIEFIFADAELDHPDGR